MVVESWIGGGSIDLVVGNRDGNIGEGQTGCGFSEVERDAHRGEKGVDSTHLGGDLGGRDGEERESSAKTVN